MGGNSYAPQGGQVGQQASQLGQAGQQAGSSLAQTTMGAHNTALGAANQSLVSGAQGVNAGMGALQGALGGYQNAASTYQPQNVTAGSLGTTNLSPYMNPFQQNVIDTTMGEMNRQEALQLNNMKADAERQGAFGGSRMAVTQAENNRNYDAQRANTLANLNSANFGNAQAQATNDINRQLSTAQGNQAMQLNMNQFGNAGLAGAGKGLIDAGQNQFQAGQNQLAGLAGQGFNWGSDLEQRNLAAGQMQNQQQQQLLDLIKGATSGWQNYGDTGLARYMGSISAPNGYGTKTGTQTTSTDPGAMGIIGGITQMIAPFMKFSDARLKKNVERAGYLTTLADDGRVVDVPLYRFHYGWEDDGDHRTIGVMAHELQAVKPSAVAEVGGYLAVHYDRL